MTRKKLIKLLMAKYIPRNDANAIAKFVHDNHLPYVGTKTYVSAIGNSVYRIDYISITHRSRPFFWYSYYKGRFYPEFAQGTSSLNYVMKNFKLYSDMCEKCEKSLMVVDKE